LRESILNNPGKLPDNIMDRHAINKDAADFLKSKDHIKFLHARKQQIDDIEHNFVTSIGLKYEKHY